MSNKRLEEIEINIARHIKNPHYRLNFCKDGYAKILLQRVEEWVACGFLTEDAKDFIENFNRYTHEFIAYISAEYTDAIVRFDINTDGEYYLTFNSDSTNVKNDLRDLVHDYRIIFERCYDYAKSRPLTKIEEGIVYSINDEDQKISFTLDTEAKTLFSLITEYRSMKEEIDEAVGQYAAFIRNTYGIQPNIDRRMLKPLKIKRNTDVNVTLIKSRTNTTKKAVPPMIFDRALGKFVPDNCNSSDTNCNTGINCDSISNNIQMDQLFTWLTKQVHDETNQEARQAYSRVLDAIKVICNDDRFSRLSIDEKIAVMHFLEDEDEANNIF